MPIGESNKFSQISGDGSLPGFITNHQTAEGLSQVTSPGMKGTSDRRKVKHVNQFFNGSQQGDGPSPLPNQAAGGGEDQQKSEVPEADNSRELGTSDLTPNNLSLLVQPQPELVQNNVGSQKIGGNEDATPPHEMDLKTANTILDAVIGTHESQITPETPLGAVSGYSYDQLRQAEEIACTDLMRKHQVIPDSLGREELIKQTSEGLLLLTLYKEPPQWESGSKREYEAIGLILFTTEKKKIFAVSVPLKNAEQQGGLISFSDMETDTFATPLENDLASFRSLWLNLRVLSANIRAWDTPGVTKPEQLADPPIPPAK